MKTLDRSIKGNDWRTQAAVLGVDPDEPDDSKYWQALTRAESVIDSFKYHQPSAAQTDRISHVREGAIFFAKVILRNVASSADQTAALRQLYEAMMTANKGIVTEGAPQ